MVTAIIGALKAAQVIGPTGAVRVIVATRPVDFRKGADGLAALVRDMMRADPFDGAIYVFRAKRADRVKLVFWDGTGVCLFAKRLEDGEFRWPKIEDGVMRLSAAQLSALARRSRLAARSAGEGHAGAEAAGLTCGEVNQGDENPRKAAENMVSSRIMTQAADALPDDPETLKAMLIAERIRSERLVQIIKDIAAPPLRPPRRDAAGRSIAARARRRRTERGGDGGRGRGEVAGPRARRATRKRRANRGALPAHLPRIETIVDIESKACPCCRGELHRIGEDVSEKLDVVPAQFRVLVVRRPKYACRACEDVVVQAPAPARLIEGGLPTEATVAHVLVSKYADHLPLYRQAQIYERQGVHLDRSTLADWVGRAAFHLRPVRERILADLRSSAKLFADETTAPVLDPGRGRTKTGQLWAYARDDRPWGGTDPPAVAYVYAPDRKASQPIAHLSGFRGVLQVDGYAGYRALAEKGDVSLAFCWSHVRRRFYELAVADASPIAAEALQRIARALCRSRRTSAAAAPRNAAPPARSDRARSSPNSNRGCAKSSRSSARRASSPRRSAMRSRVGKASPASSTTAGSRSTPTPSSARSARSLSIARMRSSPAPTAAARTGRSIASLIETCKLNGVDPYAYLADVARQDRQRPSQQRHRRPAPLGLRRAAAAQSRGLRTSLTNRQRAAEARMARSDKPATGLRLCARERLHAVNVDIGGAGRQEAAIARAGPSAATLGSPFRSRSPRAIVRAQARPCGVACA